MPYITDGTIFNEVNASPNTALTPPAPQSGINFYFPGMVSKGWYRYYETSSTKIIETAGVLSISSAGKFNGIMQKLTNLIVGESYDIIINKQNVIGTNTKLYIYSGLRLVSSHTITLLGTGLPNNQIITFTASSTSDTIVIGTDNATTLLLVNSIDVVTTPRTFQPNPNEVVFPSSVSPRGIVSFTDGFSEVTPSQQICESYGYKYNKVLGTCSSFTYNTELFSSFNDQTNKFYGVRNIAQTGTMNTLIMGMNNTVRGQSMNSIITGTSNVIDNGVNNANVSGVLGEATASNSIVLGGNAGEDALGERQNVTLMFGALTTNNSVTDSPLNNTAGSFFAIPENTILVFQSETVGVRVGGTGGGSVGDFKGFIETGVAINESGTLSIDKSRSTIANTGTTSGWVCDLTVSGTNLVQTVKGANNRNIMWATTIRITQIKTGVAL